jgi:hypothetical protein
MRTLPRVGIYGVTAVGMLLGLLLAEFIGLTGSIFSGIAQLPERLHLPMKVGFWAGILVLFFFTSEIGFRWQKGIASRP